MVIFPFSTCFFFSDHSLQLGWSPFGAYHLSVTIVSTCSLTKTRVPHLSARVYFIARGRTLTPNMPRPRKTKKKEKQVQGIDSSHSYSPNNQSESWDWDIPYSERKRLISNSSCVTPARRASLRLAKLNESRTTPVQVNQVLDSTVMYACDSSVRSSKKTQDFVAQENYSDNVAEMDKVSEGKNLMTNHSIQMEEHNNAQCIPLELEPLAEGIQASRVNNNSNSILMLGEQISHASPSHFSLNITEMVNMCNNEDDEVDSVGQSSPTYTVEGYQVKSKYKPILRKILTKHGYVFENCTESTVFQSIFLEVICDIISELQAKNIDKIKEDELHNMIVRVNEIKTKNVNIEWLHKRLQDILEARQIFKQSGTLKQEKDSNKMAIETSKRELKEYEADKKALAAMFRSVCDKEIACKESLARAENESIRIKECIAYAKSKIKPFFNCSLVDDLL